jgi:hypothetical protein
MYVSVGKPLLTVATAACIAVAATAPAASAAATAPSPHTVVSNLETTLVASTSDFQPLPVGARELADLSVADVNSIVSAADDGVSATPVDTGTLILQLLTFPYHNALGIAQGFGAFTNTGLQLASLPFSIATYLAVNQPEKIPAYVNGVLTSVGNAIPALTTAIQNEINYDINLFGQVFGGATTATGATALAAPDVSAAAPVDTGTYVLQLLTFPYHNALGIAQGFGAFANTALQLVSLPFSVATYLAVNQPDKIPGYVNGVLSSVGTAIPTLAAAFQKEIDYDTALFSGLGSILNPTSTSTATSTAAVKEDAKVPALEKSVAGLFGKPTSTASAEADSPRAGLADIGKAVKSLTGKPDSTKADSTKTDSTKGNSTKADSTKADSKGDAKPGSGKQHPSKSHPSKSTAKQ